MFNTGRPRLKEFPDYVCGIVSNKDVQGFASAPVAKRTKRFGFS